jgi:hypothetical protein
MSDLPYGPFGFPNVRAWGMAPPINVQDDLEASATPMPVEPTVRPKRKKAPAKDQGVAAFQAVLEDVGGDYDQAIATFAFDLVDAGVSPERAQQAALARAKQHQSLSRDPNIFFEEMGTPLPTSRQPQAPQGGASQPVPFGAMPDADPRTTRAERLAGVDATAAKWERQKAAYDRATGLSTPDEGYVEEEGPYPGAGRPGYDRTLTFDEVMASREQAEAERAARMRPMKEAAKRDMKARAQWREDNPEQAENLAANARARADDYRRERLMYRMAEKSGRSIAEIRKSPQFASVGQMPSRDGGAIPTLERTPDGMQLRDMPVSLSADRDAAATQRAEAAAGREKLWRAQMTLAGQNLAKNAANAFSILTPEQQQDVVSTRMRFPGRDGGRSDEWDRRLDVMRLQMENDRTEREKDRTLTREERQAAREADERRFAEERARRDQEWKERSAQFERDNALRRDTLAQEGEVARQRHEQGMVGLQGQLAQITNQGAATTEQLALTRQKMEDESRIRDEAMKRADLERRQAAAVQQYGPGAAHILANDFNTPDAQAAFRSMAAQADQTWNGFFTEDARRLDSILVNLGITDPEKRRQLVQEYGINSDFLGQQGRGSMLSAWRVRHPDYLPVE